MNLFASSCLVLSLSSILFSFIVYRSDPHNKVNKYWFISSMVFSLWSFALFEIALTTNDSLAFFWQNMIDVSAVFIPLVYVFFLFEFLGLKQRKLRIGLFVLAAVFAEFSLTPLFKSGITMTKGFFWVDPGPYYLLFPVYFMVYAVISVSLLVISYGNSEKGSPTRKQIRNMIIGSLIGYLGGVTNFFPDIFGDYPYGNYLIIFYIIFMIYGVIRYRSLNVKTISTQLFSGALISVVFFTFMRSVTVEDGVVNSITLVLVITFSMILIIANDHLNEVNREKSEFVSFATHQLRAPLTAMKGYGSLILEGDMGEVNPEVRQAVSRMYESTKTLGNIVDDYLDVTRIELGTMKYSFERVDLKALIEDVIGELGPNLRKEGVVFDFKAEEMGQQWDWSVRVDRDKLKQVVANLLDNSIKYTPSGWVHSTLSFDRKKRKFVFKIEDNGVGIAPETISTLFNKFIRARSASISNVKGTGLGLYVARQIVEAHRGSIRAISPGEGKGSTFVVELDPFVKL